MVPLTDRSVHTGVIIFQKTRIEESCFINKAVWKLF